MSVDLGWLAAETQRLKLAARRVHREVSELRDLQAGVLGRLDLPAGEAIDECAVIDFLRRTLEHTQQEGVVITVSQPARAQTKEQHG